MEQLIAQVNLAFNATTPDWDSYAADILKGVPPQHRTNATKRLDGMLKIIQNMIDNPIWKNEWSYKMVRLDMLLQPHCHHRLYKLVNDPIKAVILALAVSRATRMWDFHFPSCIAFAFQLLTLFKPVTLPKEPNWMGLFNYFNHEKCNQICNEMPSQLNQQTYPSYCKPIQGLTLEETFKHIGRHLLSIAGFQEPFIAQVLPRFEQFYQLTLIIPKRGLNGLPTAVEQWLSMV